MNTSTGAPGVLPVVGIIGGSGIYEIDGLEGAQWKQSRETGAAHTTWPSGLLALGHVLKQMRRELAMAAAEREVYWRKMNVTSM